VETIQEPVEVSVSIILPAYNEETAVGSQVEDIHRVLSERGIIYEVIVVDDGSEDRTAEEAAQAGARVFRHPRNRGYGAALKTGIGAAKYGMIVTIDADGTYPADAIPQLLEKAHEYDMVVGARTSGSVQVPFARRPAKWFLRTLAGYLAGESIPDLNSGLRVLKRSVVEEFDYVLPSGYSFAATITIALLCNDYLVYYHPIEYYRRIGRSKVQPIDAYHFLLLVIRTIVYFNPLKVFLPLGAMLFLVGMGKFVYDLFLGNLSESAVLGFLGAFVIWAIGLLSDQIARVGLASRPR